MKSLIILLMFLTFYIEVFPKQTQILNINYEHSQFLNKNLGSVPFDCGITQGC